MKRVIFTAGILILMLSANVSFAQTKTTKKTTTHKTVVKKTTTKATAAKKPSAADLEAGKGLLAKSDCLSCHKVDMKIVGPAYIDVAKKYPANEANYELLTKKVIAGGSGNWGTTAMAAHPTLAAADVKKMVEYILSLK
ncbi:MAG: c-type cytochrome [Mucilaginibacter sp.]